MITEKGNKERVVADGKIEREREKERREREREREGERERERAREKERKKERDIATRAAAKHTFNRYSVGCPILH